MNDLARSLAALGLAFAAVVAATLGLAGAIVPGPAAVDVPPATTDASGNQVTPPPVVPAPTTTGRPGIGGTLAVSGDREGTFALTRETTAERYSLTGSDGRISFAGQPVEVAQLSYDGLEFFPDPEDCEITALNLDTAIGVGRAELACTDLEDVRGNGTISLAGEIGLPVDMLAARTLPFTGGSLEVGPETWTFDDAFLFAWEIPIIGGRPQYNLELIDRSGGQVGAEQPARLNIHYDIETHALTPINVERSGELSAIPEGACQLVTTELGRQNPRTRVLEIAISCDTVDVPGLGAVPISGTVVVDELAWPE
ncbi:MAG TPA: hypothetical protein VLA76_08690 [Candidatus Angelobacter sp.]|nr:hypothetical protein [Candidatus Angelobacter sp.]